MGRTDAYSEAGINEKGVSCSATLSTSYNEEAAAADPIDEEVGLGEYSYGSIILGESATAREGVELLGSLIDDQGVCTNDQIIIADNNETWLFATLRKAGNVGPRRGRSSGTGSQTGSPRQHGADYRRSRQIRHALLLRGSQAGRRNGQSDRTLLQSQGEGAPGQAGLLPRGSLHGRSSADSGTRKDYGAL